MEWACAHMTRKHPSKVSYPFRKRLSEHPRISQKATAMPFALSRTQQQHGRTGQEGITSNRATLGALRLHAEDPQMSGHVCRGYVNTSAVKSAISFIDGDKGILRYRGYPIEQLAERSNYTEVTAFSQNYEKASEQASKHHSGSRALHLPAL